MSVNNQCNAENKDLIKKYILEWVIWGLRGTNDCETIFTESMCQDFNLYLVSHFYFF